MVEQPGSVPRDLIGAWPPGREALRGLEAAISRSGMDRSLLELVKMRVSQINRCAYCLDMHSKNARARGETEQRLYALSAWDEAPFFTDRERAALALAEALTTLAGGPVPDHVERTAAEQFPPEELSVLVFTIIAIDGWNRLMAMVHAPVGSYQPPSAALG